MSGDHALFGIAARRLPLSVLLVLVLALAAQRAAAGTAPGDCQFYAGGWSGTPACSDKPCGTGTCAYVSDLKNMGTNDQSWLAVTPLPSSVDYSTWDPLQPMIDIWGRYNGGSSLFSDVDWSAMKTGTLCSSHQSSSGSAFPATMLTYNVSQFAGYKAQAWCLWLDAYFLNAASFATPSRVLDDGATVPAVSTLYPYLVSGLNACGTHPWTCSVQTCSNNPNAANALPSAPQPCPANTRSACQESSSSAKLQRACQRTSGMLNWTRRADNTPFEDVWVPSRMSRAQASAWCGQFTVSGQIAVGAIAIPTNGNTGWMFAVWTDSGTSLSKRYGTQQADSRPHSAHMNIRCFNNGKADVCEPGSPWNAAPFNVAPYAQTLHASLAFNAYCEPQFTTYPLTGASAPCRTCVGGTLCGTQENDKYYFYSFCTRSLMPITVTASHYSNTSKPCYVTRDCHVYVNLPIPLTRQQCAQLVYGLTASGNAFPGGYGVSSGSVTFNYGNQNLYAVLHPWVADAGQVDAAITNLRGWGFQNGTTGSITVSALGNILVSGWTAGASDLAVYFHDQSVTLTLTDVAGDPAGSMTLITSACNGVVPCMVPTGSPFVTSTGTGGPYSFAFTVSSSTTATTPVTIRFQAADNRYYNTQSTALYNVDVRTPGTISASGVPATMLADSSFTLTVQATCASLVYYAVTVTPSSTCSGLTFSPTSVTFSVGASSPSATITVTANAAMTSQSCTITYARTAGLPQWPSTAADNTVFVNQLIVVSIGTDTAWTPAMQCNTPTRFSIDAAANLYSGTVTVTPTCGTASIVAVAGTDFTTSIKMLRYDINATCSTSYSCTMSFTLSGPSLTQMMQTSLPTAAGSWSNLNPIGSSMVSLTYVGRVFTMTFTDNGLLTSPDTIVITWSFSNSTLLNVSSGTITLVSSAGTVVTYLQAVAAGSGTFTYSASTVPLYFSNTVPSKSLTISPLKTLSISPATIPANLSLGVYSFSISCSASALPASGQMTLTPSFSGTYLAITPASVQWASSDASNTVLTFTVTGVSVTAATAISVAASGTAPDFDLTQTWSLGSVRVYQRALVNTTVSSVTLYDVAGSTATIGFVLSAAQPFAFSVTPTLPAIVTGAPTVVSFAAGATTSSLVLSKSSTGTNDATFALSGSNAAWMNGELEGQILPVSVSVLAARTSTFTCNASQLYFGTGFALLCTATIPVFPAGHTVTVRLSSASANVFEFTSLPPVTPSATASASFSAGVLSQSFIATPKAPYNGVISEGLTYNISMNFLTDTSFSFDPTVKSVGIVCNRLKQVSLSLVTTGPIYVGMPFTLSATTDAIPVNPLTVTCQPSAFFAYAFPTVSLYNDTSGTLMISSVTATCATANTYVVQWNVAGSSEFDVLSIALSPNLWIRSLVSVTDSTVPGTVTLYAGQMVQITLSASVPPLSGTGITFTPQFYCNGVAASGAVTFAPTSFTWDGSTTTATAIVNVTAVSACPSGGKVFWTRNGSSVIYAPQVNSSVNTRALEAVTAVLSNVIVYGGNVNSTTIFLRVTALPSLASGVLTVTLSNNNTGLFTITGPAFGTVFGSGGSSSLEIQLTGKANAVVSPQYVSIGLSISGNAVSEYYVATMSVLVTVLPTFVVSVSNTLTLDPNIFVGGQFARLVRVTLPTPPEFGTVRVAANFDNGAASSVSFSCAGCVTGPPGLLYATLSNANPFVDFNVTAVTATSGTEAIRFSYTGTAPGYFPQADSAQYPVTFWARGTVTIGTVPPSLFQSLTAPVSITISYAPPSGYGTLTVSVTPASGAMTVSPSFVSWSTGDATLTKSVTLTGVTVAPAVGLTFSLTGPSIYLPQPSLTSATVEILDSKAVVFVMPAFVYVNAPAVTVTCSIVLLPAAGTNLDVVPAVSGTLQPLTFVPNKAAFTPSTAKTLSLSLSATVDSPSVIVSFNLIGTANGNYVAPPSVTVEIRPLETMIITGLPSQLYVGQSATVTVTVSRLPIRAGTFLRLTPTFGSGAATFLPAYQQWLSDGSTPLVQTFTFVTSAPTLSPVSVSWAISGTQLEIYEAAVQSAVPSVMIFDKETVTVTTSANQTDGLGGFAYQYSGLALNVSLGTPIIAHTGVTVSLSYLDVASSATFSPNPVVFAPGVNSVVIQMNSELTSYNALLAMAVTVSSDVFVPATMPMVRLLPQIAVTLAFNPATQPLVVGRTITVTVIVASTALAGDLTVNLSYGPEVSFGAPVTFLANTGLTSKTITISGVSVSAVKNVTMVFNNTGGRFYTSAQMGFPAPVLPQKPVLITVLPAEVYTGSMNVGTLVLALSSTPTVASDSIRIVLTESSQFGFVGSSSGVLNVDLTASTPSATVSIEGFFPGAPIMANFMAVSSVSQEFQATVGLGSGVTTSVVNIRQRLTVTSANYIQNFFTSQRRTFNFTLPQVPTKGVLTLTPRLTGTSYVVTLSPTTLVFSNVPGSQLWAELNVTAGATPLTIATFELAAAGSTDYLDVPFSSPTPAPFSVVDASLVVVSGVPAFMYPGAINTVSLSVSISRPPTGNLTVTFVPTGASPLAFTPASIVFNDTTPLDLYVDLRATMYVATPATFTLSLAELPTPYFNPTTQPSITIRAPDVVTPTLSTTTVYLNQILTITITLSTMPVQDLFLAIVLKKNQTGTGLAMIPLAPGDATVPTTLQNMNGRLSTTFAVTATTAPLPVEVSFLVDGPAAKTFLPQELLPKFIVLFAPLRKVTVNVPAEMYLNLEANVTITLEKSPETGTVQVSAIPSGILGLGSSPSFTWSSAGDAVTVYFTCRPTATGSADILFSIFASGTVAYEATTRPAAQMFINVKPPTVIGLSTPPVNVFFQLVNAINLAVTVTGDALVSGLDDVTVTLTTNCSTVVMVPSNGVLRMPLTSGIFTIYSTAPNAAYFNLSFTSTLNRFVLSSGAVMLPVTFRPLKPIFVVPPLTEYIVGQPVPFLVYLDEKPSAGPLLIASLSYSGSPGNINLPPNVGWSSLTLPANMNQTLTAAGLSSTGVQYISVDFSGDPQYNMTSFVWPMKFNPLLNILPSLPNSAFYNRTISNVTVVIEAAMNVTVTPVCFVQSLPNPVIDFTPPSLSWEPSQTVLTRSWSMRPQSMPTDLVEVRFVVTGSDANKFNAIPPQFVSIVASDAILIIAPASSMTLFLKLGYTIRIGVQISEPALGILFVTPTWGCGVTGHANFTVTPLRFDPSSPTVLYTEVFGIAANPACSINFPLSGFTGSFIGTSQLYSVTVRPLYVISLEQPFKRVFLGPPNRRQIFVRIDKDLEAIGKKGILVPPTEQIVATFSTTEPCLSINPNQLIWAKGSTTEAAVKDMFVTATCIDPRGPTTDLYIYVNVSTIADIYNITVPSRVAVNAVPLLPVTATDVAGTTNKFYLWVGDAPLTFDVSIPEALDPAEQLEVIPRYGGVVGSMSALSALWSPSPQPKLNQFAIITARTISPEYPLTFQVSGPPRFEPWALGGGTLEIFGALQVTASVPNELIAGRNYTIDVEVEDRPFPGRTLLVSTLWIGAATAMRFLPPSLTWTFDTPLKQTLLLMALEPSGAYRLQFPVTGSSRFVDSAFDAYVPILAPVTITHSKLPQQLMMGTAYSLIVDITGMPKPSDVLHVLIEPQKLLLDCIVVSPAVLTWTTDMAMPSTSLWVSVSVNRVCDQSMLNINFVVYGNASEYYNRTVLPRKYQTIAWAPLAVSWQSQAYVGVMNKPEVILNLNQLPTGLNNVTVLIDQVIDNATLNVTALNVTYPMQVVWLAASSAEVPLTFWAEVSSPGRCTLRFTLLGPSGYPAYAPSLYTIEFFPLITITRSSIASGFYQNDKNKIQVLITLSHAVRALENVPPLKLVLTPAQATGRVAFQPATLTWAPSERPTATLYITGLTPGPDSISFSSAVWQLNDNPSTGQLAANGLPPADVVVYALVLITYTPQPAILYVGAANARNVTLTAPATTSTLQVTISVDGEQNALTITPKVLTWYAQTPRSQVVKMQGEYSSPVKNLLRYKVVVGPTYIDVQSTVGAQSTVVTAPRPVLRTPNRMVFTLPERSQFNLTFNPNLPVSCKFPGKENVTTARIVPTTNLTEITLVLSGTSTAVCTPLDSTYAELAWFTIIATPLKRLTISPQVANTFIDTDAAVDFSVTEIPAGGTMLIQPDLTGIAQYFTFAPTPGYVGTAVGLVLFTAGSPTLVRMYVRGTNLTSGEVRVPLKISGPISEYLIEEDQKRFFVNIRAPINVSVTPSKILRDTMKGSKFITYIGGVNGGVWDVDITGVPLSGAIRITMVSDDSTLLFSPTLILFPVNSPTLKMQVKVWSDAPISAAKMWGTVVAPAEYIGPVRLDFGTITILALEKITGLNSLLPTIYVLPANQQRLDVAISGYPRPGQTVSVLGTPECGVSVAPAFLEFRSDRDVASEPLIKSFSVLGDTPQKLPCRIVLSWFTRPNSVAASNFDESVVDGVKQVLVSDIITFALASPTSNSSVPGAPLTGATRELKSFDIYNTRANGQPVTVTLTGLPEAAAASAKVTWTVAGQFASGFQFSTNELSFAKGAALSAPVVVYGQPSFEGNATLTFTLTGTTEFKSGQQISVFGNVRKLLAFTVLSFPKKFPMGIDNAQTFYLRPLVPAAITVDTRMSCSAEVSMSAPKPLVWLSAEDWLYLPVVMAGQSVTDADACELKVVTTGGMSLTTFFETVLQLPTQAVARPQVLPERTSVPYTAIRGGGGVRLTITLSGEGFYLFHGQQKFTPGSPENSTIFIGPEDAGDDAALAAANSELLGAIKASNNFVQFEPGQLRFEGGLSNSIVVVLANADFVMSRREDFVIRVRRTALSNNAAFEAKRDFVRLSVSGQAEELAGAANVVSNGVSAATIAMAAMELHATLFPGRMLSIMALATCPDPGWKRQQLEWQWHRNLFPIAFGGLTPDKAYETAENLGVFAAVGLSTVLTLLVGLCIHFALAWLLHRYRLGTTAWDKSFGAALALMRFPSFDFFPTLFYYQITLACSLLVITDSPSVPLRFVGALWFLALGFGVPILVLLRVQPGFQAKWYTSEAQFMEDVRKLEQADLAKTGGNTSGDVNAPLLTSAGPAQLAEDRLSDTSVATFRVNDSIASQPAAAVPLASPAESVALITPTADAVSAAAAPAAAPAASSGGVSRFLKPTGFWRCPEDIYWVPRYGMLFDRYSEKFKAWLVFEIIFSFVLGVIDGIAPNDAGFCRAKAVVMILLYLALFLLLAFFRPFRRPWWNFFLVFVYFLKFLTVCLIGDAVKKGDKRSPNIDHGMTVLVFTTFLLVIKAVLDLIEGVMDVLGVHSLMQLRVTGRVAQAAGQRNDNDNQQEMKAQLANADFVRLMAAHTEAQAIEHKVAEKAAERDRATKEHARTVVHAAAAANPFEAKPAAKPADFDQADLDFI